MHSSPLVLILLLGQVDMANRVLLRASLRAELSDPAELWTDQQLNRVVAEVTADFSRMIPRERLNETTFVRNVTAEAVTAASAAGTATVLVNKPIQVNSVVVTSDPVGTTYVLDTDFQVDYTNGTITHLAAGAISNGESLLVTYGRSSIALDISGLTDLILPLRMEWPLGRPQEYVSFYRWGDILYVQTSSAGSQQNFGDTNHILLYYYAEHTVPTDAADGSFPRFLDDVMVKGGVAYALFIKARDRRHQAVTDLASARTALAAAATLQATTEMDSAEAAAAAAKTRADGILDTVADTDLATARTQAANAGTLAAAVLDTAGATELTNAQIFTTAITAMDEIEAFVGGVSDSVTEALKALRGSAGEPLNDLITALDKVKDELELGGSTDNVELFLSLGEPLIDEVNNGVRVPENFNDYARTKLDMATTWIAEAQGRSQHAQALIGEANQWSAGANAFILEARERFRQLEVNISIAREKIQQELLNVQAGQVHGIAAGQYNEEARTSVSQEELNAQAGQVLVGAAQAHAAAAQARINFIQDRISEGQAYLQASQQEIEASDRFIVDAQDKYTAYWVILRDRVQKARPHGMVSTKQYVTPFAGGSRILTGDETGPS